MKQVYHFTFTIIFFIFSLIHNESYSQSKSSVNDVEALKKLEYDWLMAEFRLDTAAISVMMDDTFISVGLTGLLNKHQELTGIYDHMSQRIKNNHIVDSLFLDDMRINIYDNTAVVTFFSVTKGRIKDVPFENRRTRMYDVWIKRKGKWKAVSSQVTPVR